jgi:hypothetical protein
MDVEASIDAELQKDEFKSLSQLLSKHSLVTFRFLAQHSELPVSEAKDVLQRFVDSNKDKVHAVYLVGGMMGESSVIQYKLVPADNLADAKAQFDPLTACHPYSVHAAPATSGEPLYILNQTQDRELYEKLSDGPNCLLDNRWAAVKCPAPTIRERKAKPPPAAPPPPRPKAPVAAPAAKPAPKSSSSSVKKPSAAAGKKSTAGGAGKNAEDGDSSAAKKRPAPAPVPKAQPKPGGFAAMFAGATAPPTAEAEAEADESVKRQKGGASVAARKTSRVLEDEDDEDEAPPKATEAEEAPAAPAAPAAASAQESPAGGKKRDVPAQEDSAAVEKEGGRGGAASKRLKAVAGESSRAAEPPTTPLSSGSAGETVGEKEPEDADEAGSKDEAAAAAPSHVTPRTIIVKERVKEERTHMDERGYLVCEEVWVEKEVEKEVPAEAPKPRFIAPQMPKPVMKGKGKVPGGLCTEDAETVEAKPTKGKAKAATSAPKKVATGAGSILGFFGKK